MRNFIIDWGFVRILKNYHKIKLQNFYEIPNKFRIRYHSDISYEIIYVFIRSHNPMSYTISNTKIMISQSISNKILLPKKTRYHWFLKPIRIRPWVWVSILIGILLHFLIIFSIQEPRFRNGKNSKNIFFYEWIIRNSD